MLIQCDDKKQCNKCLEWKPFTDFYKTTSNQGSLDAYRKQCKICHSTFSHSSENRKDVASRYYKRKKEENPALFMWKQAKHRAKYDYDDLEFSIEVGDIIIPEKCPYFNVSFIPLDKQLGYSLDRIDSSRGYVKDNIRVITYKANRMKSDATKEDLIAFAKGILNLHGDI